MSERQICGENGIKACTLCCTRIEDFGVALGGTEILEGINLHIHCGELTALIGPNGAGKSTLLKAITGEIKHSGKLIFLDEKGVRTGHPVIGYVPQNMLYDRSSPASVLDFYAALRSSVPVWLAHSKKTLRAAEEALDRVKAEQLLHRKIGALSGGELQRVLLALALDPIPDILLLDEPVSGVDRNGLEIFYGIVSELREKYDMTIILVSHDLPLVARYADRVVFLDHKVINVGTPSEVFNSPELVKLFGKLDFDTISDDKNGRERS